MNVLVLLCITAVFMMVSGLLGCGVGVFTTYIFMHKLIETNLNVARALVQISEKEASAHLALAATKLLANAPKTEIKEEELH